MICRENKRLAEVVEGACCREEGKAFAKPKALCGVSKIVSGAESCGAKYY
jgi:hypothetical protein